MEGNINIPLKIKVGYQDRNDTYTKRLAYVIYYDEKNVLRKQVSWDGWRDEKIEPDDFENVPSEGFVLNKTAGGYSTGWNHRQTYTRVYDPRGFEFEITIENLLYILENTSSIKGKGLEGEFVYGWSGKDLILIPCGSPDYQKLIEFNDSKRDNKKIKAKDLILGATYLSNKNEKLIYIGRFTEYILNGYSEQNKNYFFYKFNDKYRNYTNDDIYKEINNKYNIVVYNNISGKLIKIIDEKCVENYSNLFEASKRTSYHSQRDLSKDKYGVYSLEEFKKDFCDRLLSGESSDYRFRYNEMFFWNINSDSITRYSIRKEFKNQYKSGEYEYIFENFNIYNDTESNCKYKIIGKFKTVEEIFNKFSPKYLETYTADGRFIERKICGTDKRNFY